MTKRAKIIIGAVIALMLVAAGFAAFLASGAASSAKSSNQIKSDIQKAFQGKSYFKDVQVKTYSGVSEVTNADASAQSAAITIDVTKMDAATFKDIAAAIPDEGLTAFYSVTNNAADPNHITNVTGFRVSDFKDSTIVGGIENSLKVQESYQSSYWQVSRGDAAGEDATKMKTQYVVKDENSTAIRQTVGSLLTDKMDVLPVAKTTMSTGSFVQFAAVKGQMADFNKGVDLVLQFANETFLHGTKITVLGIGNQIQVTYDSLENGWDQAKLTSVANSLNTDKTFQITVESSAQASASPSVAPSGTSNYNSTPSATASATPSPSASK